MLAFLFSLNLAAQLLRPAVSDSIRESSAKLLSRDNHAAMNIDKTNVKMFEHE